MIHALLFSLAIFLSPARAWQAQSGLSNHNHTTATNDGGQLSNLNVLGSMSAAGPFTVSGGSVTFQGNLTVHGSIAGDITSSTGTSGTSVPAGNIINGPLSSSILPSTVAFQSVDNNWSNAQTSQSSWTIRGNLQVVGNIAGDISHSTGIVASSVLPSTVAYTTIDNNWSSAQTQTSSTTWNGGTSGAGTGISNVQIASWTASGSFLWTVPPNVNTLHVTACGAGGGGSATGGNGGGGGGASMINQVVITSAGAQISIIVGAGGGQGAAGGTTSLNIGQSSFSFAGGGGGSAGSGSFGGQAFWGIIGNGNLVKNVAQTAPNNNGAPCSTTDGVFYNGASGVGNGSGGNFGCGGNGGKAGAGGEGGWSACMGLANTTLGFGRGRSGGANPGGSGFVQILYQSGI